MDPWERPEERMPELVLVDFDDTLVETAPAFHGAREALFSRLEEEGFPRELSFQVHHEEVEPELLPLLGMGPFRMEPSFRETYLRLCANGDRVPESGVTDEVGALGRDFMGQPKVMEGSLEALEAVAGAFPTVIYSQAAQVDYQMGRIREAGVLEILEEDRVQIKPRKTPEAFLEVLDAWGIPDPSQASMVGNSMRSDINPALMVGAGALLVEPYEMWHYDNVPPFSDSFLRFETFPEAAHHLLEHGSRI